MDRSASNFLSWLLLPVAALLVAAAIGLPARPYTGLVAREGQVVAVLSGSPAARAGIRAGDRIRSVDGVPLGAGRGVASSAVLGRALDLDVVRGEDSRHAWLVPVPLPHGERRMTAALLLVASGFVLLGGWVWTERRDPLTRTFLLLCLCFAGLLAPLPSWGSAPGRALAVMQTAVAVFLPALFVHFFALFPDRAPGRNLSALVRAGYTLASGLFVTSVAVAMAGRPSGAFESAIETAAALWFAVGVLIAIALFAGAVARADTRDTRKRLRVAFVGILLGVGPLAALILFRNLAPTHPLPGDRVAVLLTLLVPASFAWAIVVHSVFDFRVALRIGAVALLLAVCGAAIYVAGEWLAATWWPHLGAGIAGMALALLTLAACVAGPLAPRLQALGSRMVPEPDRLSLAAWAPRTGAGRPLEQLLEDACGSLFSGLRLDGCAVVMMDPPGHREAAFAGVLQGAIPALPAFADAELASGVRELDEIHLDRDARGLLEHAGVRWVLPVGTPTRALALLGRRLAGSWFGRSERFELERFADHLSVAIENATLRLEAHGRDHIDRELREAGEIQAHLLPRRAPVLPTLDCAAAALASESVGGDYYDFVQGPGRDFTLVVGDAAGKGVPAALVLAGVQARFRTEARRGLGPARLLEVLNDELVGLDQPEKFMGLLCARVEARTGRLTFANAGLTPPLLRRSNGRWQELTMGGVLLGVSADARYEEATVPLGADDVLVIYSDGLTEARRGPELFGVERVLEVLEHHAGRRASDILEAMIDAARAFADQPLDDVTVVILKQLTGRAEGPQPAESERAKGLKWRRMAAENH